MKVVCGEGLGGACGDVGGDEHEAGFGVVLKSAEVAPLTTFLVAEYRRRCSGLCSRSSPPTTRRMPSSSPKGRDSSGISGMDVVPSGMARLLPGEEHQGEGGHRGDSRERYPEPGE